MLRRVVLAGVIAAVLGLAWFAGVGPQPVDPEPVTATTGEIQGAARASAVAGQAAETAATSEVSVVDADCPDPELVDILDGRDSDTVRQLIADLAVSLEDTGDPELDLAAAYIGQRVSPEKPVHVLQRLADNPNRPLAFWLHLSACGQEQPADASCDPQFFIAEAERSAADNAVVWGNIAGLLYEAGNHDQALVAMQRARTAPEMVQYWPEQLQLFERVLQIEGSFDYIERVYLAIGLTAVPPGFAGTYQACAELGAVRTDWREACLDYAGRLQREGQMLLDERTGLAIERAIALAEDDTAWLAELQQREHDSLEVLRRVALSDEVIFTDEKLLSNYVDIMLSSGERAALQYSTGEIAALMAATPCGEPPRRVIFN